MPKVKIHITFPPEYATVALRAQTMIAVNGIKCSLRTDKNYIAKKWHRIIITENGTVGYAVPPFAIVSHIVNMIEALIALWNYGGKEECQVLKNSK